MKNLKYLIFSLFAICIVSACSKSYDNTFNVENSDQYSQIYSAQALNDTAKNLHIFPMTTDTTLKVYANFGGIGYPERDIKVKFKVAPELVEKYNEENTTEYPMALAESYDIENLEVTIPKGGLRSNAVDVNIDANQFDGVGIFILPLYIESTDSDIAINDNLRTAYVLIKGFYEENPFTRYDRTAWKIHGYSTQEPGEGGGRGGAATDALDSKNNTYWCSAWRKTKPGPPHWIAVDLGEATEIHGVDIRGRAEDNNVDKVRSTGNPRQLQIHISNDGDEWNYVGEFSLINELENTLYLDHKKTARYIKITVIASHGDTYGTNIAEINAF